MLCLLQWSFYLPTYTSISLVLLNYTVITTLSFIAFSYISSTFIKNLNTNTGLISTATLFSVLFFLNLAGVPPLPGFFIKLNLLTNLFKNFNIYLIIIVLLLNFTIFYFYIQFYKSIYSYTKVKCYNEKVSVVSICTLILLLLLNFLPAYNLLTLFIL